DTARGDSLIYTYNHDNLLVQTDYPDIASTIKTYDEMHNLTNMSDSLGETISVFDALDRLSSSRNHVGRMVSYGYDSVGNVKTLGYDDGRVVRYEYDANNR